MSKTTIVDTDYATLWYHPEKKIVHHVFHKFIYGEEFRQVLEKGLEIFKEHGAQKWLSDDRNNSALPTADTEWGMHDWFPRVFEAGWRYWAIVMPDKAVGQMNMQRFIDAYAPKGLAIKLFEDPDEALKWLESA
jgi:hypothetical protein